jgi:hypothetical protein
LYLSAMTAISIPRAYLEWEAALITQCEPDELAALRLGEVRDVRDRALDAQIDPRIPVDRVLQSLIVVLPGFDSCGTNRKPPVRMSLKYPGFGSAVHLHRPP